RERLVVSGVVDLWLAGALLLPALVAVPAGRVGREAARQQRDRRHDPKGSHPALPWSRRPRTILPPRRGQNCGAMLQSVTPRSRRASSIAFLRLALGPSVSALRR